MIASEPMKGNEFVNKPAVESPLAAQLRRGTIFDQDDHMIIQRITQLNLLSTAAKKISASSFLLDGLDEQHEKEKHLDLASMNDRKLHELRKSHSFSIRNRRKYANFVKKKYKRNSHPSLDALRNVERVASQAVKKRDRAVTSTTNPTTGRTYKRYVLDSPDDVREQMDIVSDRQRAHTLVSEQKGFGLLPSRSTTGKWFFFLFFFCFLFSFVFVFPFQFLLSSSDDELCARP
jgi:hypothetical protein